MTVSTTIADPGSSFQPLRHTIPLRIAVPSKIRFSTCSAAPGLELRSFNEADRTLFRHVGETCRQMIDIMQTVPILEMSYVIVVNEQEYGRYLEGKITSEIGKERAKQAPRILSIGDVFKMVVVALNLFQLCPIYDTPYFITEEIDKANSYPSPLRVRTHWDTWQKYAVPRGHDLTTSGLIECPDLVQALDVLEKYYRYNAWKGNRVATALHNFWNAFFVPESTLAYLSLWAILETFSSFESDDVLKQIYRNIPKLIPLDAHSQPVTKGHLSKLYKTRSIIAHGSYQPQAHGKVNWAVTHLDAKFANVDVHETTAVMSLVIKLLYRVLFDSVLMSRIETAGNSRAERKVIQAYVNSLPPVHPPPRVANYISRLLIKLAKRLSSF